MSLPSLPALPALLLLGPELSPQELYQQPGVGRPRCGPGSQGEKHTLEKQGLGKLEETQSS